MAHGFIKKRICLLNRCIEINTHLNHGPRRGFFIATVHRAINDIEIVF